MRKPNFSKPSRAIDYYEDLVESGRLTMAMAASEFGAYLAGSVKNLMNEGVRTTPSVYLEVTKQETSNRRWERYAGTSVPTGIKKVQPGEEAPDLTFSSDSTVIVNERYSGKLTIPNEFLEDDETGEIRRRATGIGQAMVEFIDQTVADDIFEANPTGYDGVTIFNTAHPDITGGATNANNNNFPATGTATEANMETITKGMYKWVGWHAQPITVAPRILLTGSDNWSNILRLVHSRSTQTSDKAEGVVNVFENIGKPVLWKRLAANDWYIGTDIMGLIFQMRKAMQVTQEALNSGSSLLSDAYIWVVQQRFGVKVTEWRGFTRCVT